MFLIDFIKKYYDNQPPVIISDNHEFYSSHHRKIIVGSLYTIRIRGWLLMYLNHHESSDRENELIFIRAIDSTNPNRVVDSMKRLITYPQFSGVINGEPSL